MFSGTERVIELPAQPKRYDKASIDIEGWQYGDGSSSDVAMPERFARPPETTPGGLPVSSDDGRRPRNGKLG
jgi:hypothetical protein